MQCSDPIPAAVDRVQSARRAAASAPVLPWEMRVLLAAAEAADACVAPRLRALVACAIADKGAASLRDVQTVRAARLAVVNAVAARGLAKFVSGASLTRITWRLVFDLWGGPDRDLPTR